MGVSFLFYVDRSRSWGKRRGKQCSPTKRLAVFNYYAADLAATPGGGFALPTLSQPRNFLIDVTALVAVLKLALKG